MNDYEVILGHYGEESQMLKAIEEMGELTSVLIRWLRDDDRVNRDDVITEIADVSIMIEQLMYIFGKLAVEDEIIYKLMRTKERINEV